MKKDYYIRSEEGREFAHRQGLESDPEAEAPAIDAQQELEVSAQQAKAMIAAGWVEEVPEKKSGGKD